MRKHLRAGQKAIAATDIGDPADKDLPGKLYVEKDTELLIISVDPKHRVKYPLCVSKRDGGAFFMATYAEVNPDHSGTHPFQ